MLITTIQIRAGFNYFVAGLTPGINCKVLQLYDYVKAYKAYTSLWNTEFQIHVFVKQHESFKLVTSAYIINL